ncbi:hypothetical protein [Glycomyces sp. NPDC047010]|uniref:hypothetical protein n=1 Tax=Glycomyces sp. NPDC047010 TaxID=3155023 RepID=UPI00340AB01D
MNIPNGPDLHERLQEAIDIAEGDVKIPVEAATEASSWTIDAWTLGDYLSDHKHAIVGKWISQVETLATIGFHARAIAWAELVALRDGRGHAGSKITEAPLLTLAELEKKFPFEGIDDVTEEEREPGEVNRHRVGRCHDVLEEQLAILGDQCGHLTWAASVGNTDQVIEALEAIDRTASAMARAYGLWMRHLKPIWAPPTGAPDDIAADYGDWTEFAAFANAE